MIIEEKIEFEGDPASVWKKVSDIQRIPEFWHGTRSLEVIGTEGGKVKVRSKFAFGGSGDVEIAADETTMTLTSNSILSSIITLASGPLSVITIVIWIDGNRKASETPEHLPENNY